MRTVTKPGARRRGSGQKIVIRHDAGSRSPKRTAAATDIALLGQGCGETLPSLRRIPDPAPNLTVEQVRELLTPSYPEIATASLAGPEDTGDALRYTFSRAIGSKGWSRVSKLHTFAIFSRATVRRLLCQGVGRFPNHRNKAAHHEEQQSRTDQPARGTPSA